MKIERSLGERLGIVDAASQLDIRPYLAAGADMALVSGQKALEGLKQRTLAPRSRKPMEQFVFSGEWGVAMNTKK